MPPPPGLRIDVGSIAAELAKTPDITQGGTVHLGEMIVSACGVISSQSGETLKFSPDDICLTDAGLLGRGSSGSVRKVMRRGGGSNYIALKEIKVTSQSHLQEIRRELETLHVDPDCHTRCPNLVDFYGAFSQEGSVFIAMECMDGSLADLTNIPDAILASMAADVLVGLDYLHTQRHLIHRDLKPSNLLYHKGSGCVKISDFGVSSTLDQINGSAHSFIGTVTYMSPERLKGESYSYAGDIWSLGITVAELALGSHPYAQLTSGANGESTEAKFWVLMQHLNNSDAPAIDLAVSGQNAAGFNPLFVDFVQKCLLKEPEQRPTAAALLKHPWITTLAGGTPEENHKHVSRWMHALQQEVPKTKPAPVNLDSALSRLVDLKRK